MLRAINCLLNGTAFNGMLYVKGLYGSIHEQLLDSAAWCMHCVLYTANLLIYAYLPETI